MGLWPPATKGDTVLLTSSTLIGPVGELVGIQGGVVSGVINLESPDVPRYGRRAKSSDGENGSVIAVSGHRHGHCTRSLTGTFGTTDIKVPRARLTGPDGKTAEWKSKVLRTYQVRVR
jgi:hypothetical protein